MLRLQGLVMAGIIRPCRVSPNPLASKGLLVRMNLDGWRELRILAAERDTTLNALAVEAFNDLLKKRGKQPVVQNPLASED
jgi:hypothetical protein